MSKLPVAGFAVLVVATVAAFFVAQHLKVTTPLIAGGPRPFPAAINPYETGCAGANRYTRFSFYLLHRADDVAVYVVDQNGTIVRTLASGRHMRRGVRDPDGNFPWDGREDNGDVAPDGIYYFRIALLHQGRTVELTKTPVQVKTAPPHPVVSSVSPALIPPARASVSIHYSGVQKRDGTVRIYRTDLPGPPRLVQSFGAPSGSSSTIWDGKIDHRAAPAGTYLVGLDVTDNACNTGHFPVRIPPPPGTTPHAGLTVRYLAAQPPLSPVPAGSSATVYVDSRRRPYEWRLQRIGARSAVAHGAGRSFALRVRLPRSGPRLYELSIRSRAYRTSVPLIADYQHSARAPRILVVLPALTWQGQNKVDDDGDGLPDTLDGGGHIDLERPLALGNPPDLGGDAAFLAYLDKAGLPYDLTTDLGLLAGAGPQLHAHKAVVFPATERWLPAKLASALRSYVQAGGHVLSVGIDSMRREVTVQGTKAMDPTAPASNDAFGARLGQLVMSSNQLITVLRDGLGIFSGTSGAFAGLGAFQPFTSVAPPAQPIASAAGTSDAAQTIVGYRLGRGLVVEIGVRGFDTSLARNFDSQELVGRLWTVLSR